MAAYRKPKTTQRVIAVAEFVDKAIDLRRDGWTLREISVELDVPLTTLAKRIEMALKAYPVEAIRELRIVEGEKLDASERRLLAIISKIAPLVPHADAESAIFRTIFDAESRLDAVRARRHRLMGALAPEQHELTGKDGGPIATVDLSTYTDAQLARLANGQSAGSSGASDAGDPPSGAPED